MNGNIIIDAGPLLAILNGDDRNHDWAVDVWQNSRPPALTCEAVLSEAAFLLRREGIAADGLFNFLVRGGLKVGMRIEDHVEDIRTLLKRYSNQPMSVADACLVRLAELNPTYTIVTSDGDFRVYRRHGNKVIPVLSPSE